MRANQAPSQGSGRAGGYIPTGRRNQIFREGNKSLRGQWQEGGDNIDTSRVQMQQIEELHSNLARAYECDHKQIVYKFARILDEDDEDRHTCLDLRFFLNYFCPIEGKYVERIIYTAKIIVPEHLRQKAEAVKRESAGGQPTRTAAQQRHALPSTPSFGR